MSNEPAQAAPNAPAPANPELKPDLAGYPSTEALVQAYRASGAEAQRLRAERDQFAAQAQAPRQEIPQRPMSPYDRMTEFGLPADAIREAITQEIGQTFAPVLAASQGRNQLVAEYPDYSKYEADVANYVNSDPQVNQKYQSMFQSNPVGAMEYAFLKFGESRRRTVQTPTTVGINPTSQAEAQIPGTRAGDGRQAPGASEQEAMGRAWDRYQKTGDPTEYSILRLRAARAQQAAREAY